MSGGAGKRAVALGAGLLVLLAAVGLASRAHAPVGSGGRSRLVGGDILIEYVLLLAAAMAVVVVPAYIYAFIAGRGDEHAALPPRKNWMLRLLLTMTALSVVAVFVAGVYLARRHDGPSPARLQPLTGLATKAARRTPGDVRFDWVPVIVVGSLMIAGLGAGAVLLVRRRREAPARGIAGELALALDEALDDLRSDLDPRATVIAAYAHMERVLARHGLARTAPEAPREYLLRVLPGVGAGGGSVERLTALYERARFSLHAIDAGMKDEAIAAVTFLRDELLGAA